MLSCSLFDIFFNEEKAKKANVFKIKEGVMGKKLVSRTAKVLSETKKSKDKEAVAIAYEHIPRDPEEQKHGSIYAVIEVEDNAGGAEAVTETIIDIFHNEYYLDSNKDSLASFEAALAKINEELAERSSEGHINWLGKLNAVLGVLCGNTLHLTQAGRAEAYLYRGDHQVQVTEGLAGDSINPLRTFINVASGDLTENDRVVFVTPGVFFKLSKSELKKFATETSPKMAVENLSKVLAGDGGTTLPNAVLLMEMISPEAFAAEPEPEVMAEAWVKEEKKPLEDVTEQTVHGAAKAFDVLGKAVSGASAFVSGKAIPTIKTKLKDFKKDSHAEQVIIESEERLSSHGNLELESESGGVLEPDYEPTQNEIRIKEETNRPKILSLERFDFSRFKGKNIFAGNIKGLRLPRGKYSYLYLGLGLLLIVGLIGGFTLKNNLNNTKVASSNVLNQAKEKYQQALSEIETGQKDQAVENLKIAEKLANEAKAGKEKTEAEKLLTEISGAKDRAMGVIRNRSSLFADFGKGELLGMYSDGSVFYGLKSDGSVYVIDSKSKTVGTVIETPNIGTSNIKIATYVPKRKTIITYTEDKNLYELDLVSKKATKQNMEGGWSNATAITTYNNNLYILSALDNQIYKHLKTSSSYAKKTSYFSQPDPNLSAGLDFGIDSDVYVLLENGAVQKYTAGTKKEYAIAGMPPETNVKKVLADINVKGLYLYEKDRIVKIDENGSFVSQFITGEVGNIKSLFVDDKTNTFYTLSDGKIYSTIF